MPKRSRTQAFGQDAIVVGDPRDAYYGLVTRIDEAVGATGLVEYHITFQAALVGWYEASDLLNNPPDPTTIATVAKTRILVLMVPEAELVAFNQQMLASGRRHGLVEGSWWLITPGVYNLRGSLRVDVFRPPDGATDPSRVVDDDAIEESMYILPRLFVPLLVVKLGIYARQ
jgi:hypothetical protein